MDMMVPEILTQRVYHDDVSYPTQALDSPRASSPLTIFWNFPIRCVYVEVDSS